MRRLAILALLAVVLAAVWLSGSAYLTNLAVVIALFALPALGLSLLMGYTGQISLGHAAFVGLGAYGTAILAKHLGLSPWLVDARRDRGCDRRRVADRLARVSPPRPSPRDGDARVRHHRRTSRFVELRGLTGGPERPVGHPRRSSVFGLELGSRLRDLPARLDGVPGRDCCSRRTSCARPPGSSMRAIAESETVAGSIGIASDCAQAPHHDAERVLRRAGRCALRPLHRLLSPGPFDVGFSIRLLLMVALGGFADIWSVLFGVAFVMLTSEVLKPLGSYDVVIYGVLLVIVMILFPRGLLHGLELAREACMRHLRPASSTA